MRIHRDIEILNIHWSELTYSAQFTVIELPTNNKTEDKDFWKNCKSLIKSGLWYVTRVWARAESVGEWLWLKGHASGARAFVDQTSQRMQSTDFLDFCLASRVCANQLPAAISSEWTRCLSFCNGGSMFLVCFVIYLRACHIFSDIPNGQK